jgi:hypothetical protein
MYFPGEPLNEKDMLISTMQGRARNPALATCAAVASSETAVMAYQWDIVLLQA